MKSSQIQWVALVAVAIIALGAYSYPSFNKEALLDEVASIVKTLGGTTNFDQLDVTDGYSVDSLERIGNVGQMTVGGAHTTLTDATGGTYTLTEAELLAANVLKFAAGGAGQAVIALTLPATSTMTTLMPTAGDSRIWYYDASALAAATTTTVTAGTGINLIGVTVNDDVIDGAEYAQITCWREADTDVTCLTSELLNAD